MLPSVQRSPLHSDAHRRKMFSMAPSVIRHQPTEGAMRAARAIQHDPLLLESTAEIVDRETGMRELIDLLEQILAQAGDLVSGRSPELAAAARAAVLHTGDRPPGLAESYPPGIS